MTPKHDLYTNLASHATRSYILYNIHGFEIKSLLVFNLVLILH